MTHATEGLLQAWVDGEVDERAAAELSGHLAVCTACEDALRDVRRMSERAREALGVLDADAVAPVLRARASLAAVRAPRRGRRLSWAGLSGLGRAAILVLALAGVAAAVVPGSPVRMVLETTLTRVVQIVRSDPVSEPAPPPAAPADGPVLSETMEMAILPANGRVRVVLHPPAGVVDVQVRLVDAAQARVEAATAQPVRLRSAAGRIEVVGLTTGAVRIEIPRHVPQATVEIGGVLHVLKADGRLRLSGPAGTESGQDVHFRIGS